MSPPNATKLGHEPVAATRADVAAHIAAEHRRNIDVLTRPGVPPEQPLARGLRLGFTNAMNILFVHQNFPGQFRRIAPILAAQGHKVIGLGENPAPAIPGVQHIRYNAPREGGDQTHPYLRRIEGQVRRAQEVARAALALKRAGFVPDVIEAHLGWGEAGYLRDVFPTSRILLYCEFFYRAHGIDVGFDPMNGVIDIEREASTRSRNFMQLLQLEAADWGVTPTRFQHSTYPAWAQARMSVVHEGIDTSLASPEGPAEFTLPDGRVFRRGDPLVTYAARQMDPYRGFHTFLRALPDFQKRRPEAQVVIVAAGEGVSYGPKPPGGGSWKDVLLRELSGQLDLSRIHFLGGLPYRELLTLFRVSAVHMYLTYPFVLSWSMLDAMACGAAILASDTAPVREVMTDGLNGVMVDFFDTRAIAEKLDWMLTHQAELAPLRVAARRTVVENYDLSSICMPRQLTLLDEVARSGVSTA